MSGDWRDEFIAAIEGMRNQPHAVAEMDQRQAAFNHHRDEVMWWASLSLLAEVRGNELVHGLCVASLRRMLTNMDETDLIILSSYMIHNTVYMISKYEDDGDIPHTLSKMFKPGNMLIAEKFIATDGGSCPHCGNDNAFDDHYCARPAEDDDEPIAE